ncbi:hypothetical protein Tco_1415194 [Tanacetum coccineum]
MTRSSTKELITPFENPERVFRLKKRLFETPGLVESSSPEFDLFSDIKEHSKEETTKIMTGTMEQYMSKTRGNYGSGVSRPKIGDKTHFELKGKFLKELRENTSNGSELEDANEHMKKSLRLLTYLKFSDGDIKIINASSFPHVLNWSRESLAQERTIRFDYKLGNPENEVSKQEVILFYNGLDVPTRQILDSKDGLASIQAQLNTLGREIKKVNEKVYAAKFGCELCKGPHYTKDCPLKEEGKTLEEAYYTQFGAPYQPGG